MAKKKTVAKKVNEKKVEQLTIAGAAPGVAPKKPVVGKKKAGKPKKTVKPVVKKGAAKPKKPVKPVVAKKKAKGKKGKK